MVSKQPPWNILKSSYKHKYSKQENKEIETLTSQNFKGTVSVISSDPPCRDGISRFTTIPLKRQSDQFCILGLRVNNSDKSSMCFCSRHAQVTFAEKPKFKKISF